LCFSAPGLAAIVVDGVLNEPEWAEAQVFEEFVITEPRTGEAAKYRTVARVLSNKDGIYIGFSNYQPPEVQRVRRRFARDSHMLADRNMVGLDFDGTSLSAYDFTVSSSNSVQDGIFTGELTYSTDWDGTWYSQTRDKEEAWYSEIHIPWTVAPMSNTERDIKTMRIYLARIVHNESLRFAFPDAGYGRSTFLSDWHPIQLKQEETSTLDWFPYLTYSTERVEDDSSWKAGIDMVWRPNNNTQITGAINPDFGQVESDDLVVNFSAFETFFSEKRPFFTENQALFSRELPLGDRLVHTRRIGASSDAGDEDVTDIDVAAKASTYGQRLDYGVFAVMEDDTRLSEGRNFASTRIQGRVGGAALGHSLNWTDRGTLDRTALVNSIDLDWRVSDEFRLEGQFMLSNIEQDANEFNDWLQLDDEDHGGFVRIRYTPNEQWQHTLTGIYYGDGFDINDMGFQQRNDYAVIQGNNRYDVFAYADQSVMRSSVTELEYGYEENTDGVKLLPWIEGSHQIVFNSTRELELKAYYQWEGADDLISRGAGIVNIPNQQGLALGYSSRRDSPLEFAPTLTVENDGTDKFSTQLQLDVQYYAMETLTLSGTARWRDYREWLLWDFDSEQMATYEATQYEVDFRLDWYPSTRQEVRLKVQWVAVSADALEGFNIGANGDLQPSAAPVSDFSVSDTAVQLRYRYELAPLSDIYVVYSRGGFWADDESNDGPGAMFQNAWDEKHTEILQAKIRYRF
jgi:hypothetical protein